MNKLFDIVTFIVVVAGIMVLVRPNSQGPALVNSVGGAFTGVLATATGSTPAGFSNSFG